VNRHPARARTLILAALALASAFCVATIVARPVLSGEVYHRYLVWNLFLAWIPFALALVIYDRAKRVRLDGWQAALFGAWLVFLPNAPYIVTDLIHFSERAVEPVWFDAVTYLAFAWTGMLLGLVALYLVHCAVRARFGAAVGWSVVVVTSVLSGLGIYLGRFLRWNSWDVLANPSALLADLVAIARDPIGKPLAVTVLFTAFIGVAYLVMYAVAELRPDSGRRA
jgi:uncharacterized membrane protein